MVSQQRAHEAAREALEKFKERPPVFHRPGRKPKKRLPKWIAWGLPLALGLSIPAIWLVGLRGSGRGGPSATDKWGGMSEQQWREQYQKRRQAEDQEEANAKKLAEAKKTEARRAAEAKKGEQQQGKVVQQAQKAISAQSVELPPIPEDYTQWTDMHYFAARLSGDPRLVPAVANRTRRSPGSQREAEFLRKLLAPHLLVELKQLTGGRKSIASAGRAASAASIAAIVAALGANGTPPARQTLAELLAGTLTTEDDRAAVQAALETLVRHPSEENDGILLAALTEPEKLRPAGQGQVTPQQLQKHAVTVVQQGGSSRLRLRVAERFLDPSSPQELRTLLTPLLGQKRPDNLEAHILLSRAEGVEPKLKALIERHLVECSHAALGHFLGIGGEQAGPDPDPERPYRAARLLWSSQLAALLDERQAAMAALAQAPDVILLAGTIPTVQARSRLLRTLARHWEEGPSALQTAGWTRTILSEPGMLAVLKTVRRSEAPSPTRAYPPRNAASSRLHEAQLSPQNRAQANKEAEDPWLAVEEGLLRELCRRFHAAGLARRRALPNAARGESSTEEVPPPIELHPGAHIVATYLVAWPGSHRAKLAGASLDPMEVYYLRIEEKARPTALLTHYQRVVKSATIHPLADGVWIEATSSAEKAGRVQSVDVLLTKANVKSEKPPGMPQELTVEVLAVVIPALF